MRISRTSTTISFFLASSATAQTYSKCNPTQQTCPADKALGTTSHVSFTSGSSSDYSGTGNSISYGSSGAQLTVSKSGDNPTLTSDWYIMFGKVDFVIRAAPGTGMVSSAILISDDLDELDWELLGADSSQAQTNYFSKGVTGSYDRGSDASVSSSQSDFNTYTIDWNAEQTTWQINGETVRTLTYASTGGQYPQTPMQVKVGAWAGGDSSNAEGTIEWAGGPINYASGPYSMYVQSINVQDYSTGSQYEYKGTSGSWQDITAVGGSVGSSGSGSSNSGSSGTPTNGDTATATWSGTHQTTGTYVTPSTYPWVPAPVSPPTGSSSTGSSSLDSGPPASSYLATLGYDTSSAPATTLVRASSMPLPSPSHTDALAAVAGCEILTTYDQQGFPTAIVVPSGYATMAKQYDSNGFLITPTLECEAAAIVTRIGYLLINQTPTSTVAMVTSQPVPGLQAKVAIANAHSSQAMDDQTFYQGTAGTSPSPFTGNSATRAGAGVALLGFLTAALAVAL